jgi:itaconate CoA-transferase
VLSITGNETEPAKVGISIADISAAMYAYTNILAALIQREKTGEGCRIDISMLESMVEWMGFPLYYTYEAAPAPRRTGASHAVINPCGSFQTGGGETIMLGIQNERERASSCEEVLGDAQLAQNARFKNNSVRTQYRDELKQIIFACFASFFAEEVIDKLDKASIANAKVNSMEDVWNHPQLRARGRWTQVETPNGHISALTPPGFSSASESRMDGVSSLAEHNESILME